ncbi:MAG: hypothetical protein BWY57_00372 [Betaproteobacteria bacterium ADurb.Bin341]|nr:MAG: hypothetical protein BWY57_00372 [Betaproteobacteria bacterium ADurb.Bin341]
MPNFDRTGPFGEGPMSGRGLGRCGGRGQAGFGSGFRNRQGLGGGAGFGFGRCIENLEYQIGVLQQSLNELKAKSSGTTEASED